MNDEYLWQKTGDDRETMELENALAVFRYSEDDPPVVPIATEERAPRRWKFALAFAVPAFAAAVLAIVMWLTIGNGVDDSDVTFVYHPEPVIVEKPAPPAAPVEQPSQPPKQPVRRVEVQPTIASVRRRSVAKTHPEKATTVALTEDERYAYQQLMLALSISSSKLKIVQDAVNGVEDKDSPTKQNNR